MQREKQEISHTPTPWQIEYQMIVDTEPSSGYNFNKVIARMVQENPESSANAKFIVKAVNEYDALKSALDEANQKLGQTNDAISYQGQVSRLIDEHERLKKQLDAMTQLLATERDRFGKRETELMAQIGAVTNQLEIEKMRSEDRAKALIETTRLKDDATHNAEEQARLNGMGSEREARLLARIEELNREREVYREVLRYFVSLGSCWEPEWDKKMNMEGDDVIETEIQCGDCPFCKAQRVLKDCSSVENGEGTK